jgi:hypothetical protein
MITDVTIGTFASNLALIVSIIGGFAFLYAKLKSVIESVTKELLAPVTKKIDDLNGRMDDMESSIDKGLEVAAMESCKNYLVACLGELEKGNELSEAEKQRFGEQYDYYTDHDGNSYIMSKVEHFKAQGKL